jgi:membrane protease YdiL (CAAX protease family)
MSSRSGRFKALYTTGVVSLVVYGFFVAQIIVAFSIDALVQSGFVAASSLQSATMQFSAAVVAYSLALLIILGVFTAVRNSTSGLKKILGISKRPQLNSIYYILLGYSVYFLLSLVLLVIAQLIIPNFNIDQKQEVGFEQLGLQFEYIVAFIALVVLAPIVEEIIFRGFLFSEVRKNLNFWWTTLIVSLLFGLVHLQLNVGVDVFALSLVLCFVREKTGAVWVSIGIHMFKNMLAFAILFLQFDIEKAILRLLN